MFSRAVGREENCEHHWLCGEYLHVWATLGLPPLMACVLSQSTLLRLQVALQGNCLKGARSCVHFPGLSHSGSDSQVLHKSTDPVAPAFCAYPRSEQLRRRCPVCLFSGPDLWLQPSWWMSTIQDPRKTWLATRSLLTVW